MSTSCIRAGITTGERHFRCSPLGLLFEDAIVTFDQALFGDSN
jgi:hypothetical protein